MLKKRRERRYKNVCSGKYLKSVSKKYLPEICPFRRRQNGENKTGFRNNAPAAAPQTQAAGKTRGGAIPRRVIKEN
jgi:hypothetical protein